MADFEENVEEMVWTTREVAATESGRDETATRPRTTPAVPAIPGMRPAATNLIFFHKNVRIYFVYIIKCFFECFRFLNVCMQCSIDVTKSVVELLRVWCRYTVIPLAGLNRRSAGR